MTDHLKDAKPETAADEGREDAQGSGLNRREFVAVLGAGTVAAASLAGGTARADAATPIYRIHPAIGVARVGNADPSTFFIGPEIPGSGPSGDVPGTHVPPYKASDGRVKPQAARFRVFEYGVVNGLLTPLREVNLDTPGVARITWTAHVANRKSAFYVENGPTGEALPAAELRNPTVADRTTLQSDFGPRTISGASAAPVEFRAGGSGGSYPELVVKRANGSTVIDYLGQLRTDDKGRLLYLGGRGASFSSIDPPQPLTHWSNNNFWFDDIADGPVTATVTLSDGRVIPMDDAGEAWVLTAPPDFAPRIASAVSLYDVLYDMGVRTSSFIPAGSWLYSAGGPLARMTQLSGLWQQWLANPTGPLEFGSFQPDFATEIQPILLNAVNYVYVTGLVNFKHSSMLDPALNDPSDAAAKDRSGVFVYLRPPANAASNGGPGTMPKLYGDNWYQGSVNFHFDFGQNGNGNAGGGGQSFPTPAHIPQYQRYFTVTPTQFGLVRAWSAGQFVPDTGAGAPPAGITAHGLDRAALENSIGGPFYPGIECGWQMRNPKLFIEPFRINVKHAVSQYLDQSSRPESTPITAGHFSRQMAIPWQADFNDCVRLLNLGWWPSQRPDDVFLNASDTLNQRVPWSRADGKWPSGSFTSSHEDMQANWWKFGFVVETFGGFVETERASSVP